MHPQSPEVPCSTHTPARNLDFEQALEQSRRQKMSGWPAWAGPFRCGFISLTERHWSRRSSMRCCLCWKSKGGEGGLCWPEGRVSLTPRPLGLSICILSSHLIVSLPLTSSLSISASLSSSRFHTHLNDRIDRMHALHGLIRAHHFIVQPHGWTRGHKDSLLWKQQRHPRSTRKTLSNRGCKYHSVERWKSECVTYKLAHI